MEKKYKKIMEGDILQTEFDMQQLDLRNIYYLALSNSIYYWDQVVIGQVIASVIIILLLYK